MGKKGREGGRGKGRDGMGGEVREGEITVITLQVEAFVYLKRVTGT